MALPEDAGPIGLGAIVVAAIAGFWAYLGKRLDARKSSPAAMVTAEAEMVEAAGRFTKDHGEAAGALVEHFRNELKIFSARCDKFEAKVEACEEHRADCEHRVTRIEARESDCELRLTDLQSRLDALMERDVAPPYTKLRRPLDPGGA